jgi:hypothetical protein
VRKKRDRDVARVADGRHSLEPLSFEHRTNELGAIGDAQLAKPAMMFALRLRLEIVELRRPSSERRWSGGSQARGTVPV